MAMATLYATHGITGAGKSTFAKDFCAKKKVVRLSHDDIMVLLYGNNPDEKLFAGYAEGVDRLLANLAQNLLQNDVDVLLDVGLFKRAERDFWRKLAGECGAKFVLFYLQCSRETALQRVLKRSKEMPDGALFIDENAFGVINARLEPLQDDEEYITLNGEGNS